MAQKIDITKPVTDQILSDAVTTLPQPFKSAYMQTASYHPEWNNKQKAGLYNQMVDSIPVPAPPVS